MNNTQKNRVIVIAIVEGNMSTAEAARRFNVSTRWVRKLLQRYREGGLQAVDPHSKAPRSNPHQYTDATITQILNIRDQLTNQGLDNGPHSIWLHLPQANRPSLATIWRILKRHDLITPQPQKRPRSSWIRFQAASPNETWQSDFTHWPLADGTDTEIITWLDDHSRYLLHVSAHQRITTPIVIDTFTRTSDIYGLPASTLTDNGMVYTTKRARGNRTNTQPNGFEQLLSDLCITQKNGRPNHPTTQGKIERYHQTLKKWLHAQPPATTINELNTQLRHFQNLYNTQRPHRALANSTPQQAYNALPKAQPTLEKDPHTFWRIRYDKVDKGGKITIRYAGELRKLHIGRNYREQRVITLIHANNTITIERETGTIIAEHTIDKTKKYQPKKRNDDARHTNTK